MIPILVLLTVLMAVVLWPYKRHAHPTFRAAPRADAAQVLIRRSYGLQRPRAAPQPEAHRTEGKDVTFADAAPETGLPQWDGLDTGPVCALGQETEDGTPCEVMLTPFEAPEPTTTRTPVLEAMPLTDDFPVEEIPLPDMTAEERQALATFNAGAFR